MIILFYPGITADSPELQAVASFVSVATDKSVEAEAKHIHGRHGNLTELYLFGDTSQLNADHLAAMPGVKEVIKVSESYQKIGRMSDNDFSFEYQGLRFSQSDFHLFVGLNAVDHYDSVKAVMMSLQSLGLQCTRMGAFKPRTTPYAFQGKGADCLPMVFELAGEHGIKIIAMEITHESQIEDIHQTLERLGNPTGVMLQIGTRNAQNYELLRAVGRQKDYPVLYKRGFGISLHESLSAVEYVAAEGNDNIVFCLRGVKAIGASPHRNLVDFAQIPVIKRLTKLPVCVDPSHAIGTRATDPDGIPDIFHATAQGVVSGTNMVLTDIHAEPKQALVDSRQALSLTELPWYQADVNLNRNTYQHRLALAEQQQAVMHNRGADACV